MRVGIVLGWVVVLLVLGVSLFVSAEATEGYIQCRDPRYKPGSEYPESYVRLVENRKTCLEMGWVPLASRPTSTPTPSPFSEREPREATPVATPVATPFTSAGERASSPVSRVASRSAPTPTATPVGTPEPSLVCGWGYIRDAATGHTYRVRLVECEHIPHGDPRVNQIDWGALLAGGWTYVAE